MTLFRYILRGFLRATLAVFAVIALVIVLFTSVENLRRFGETGAGFGDILKVTLLQAPEVLYQVFPLVLMLSSLMTFLRFARTSELVVMRASGVSALELIAVPVAAAMLIGIAFVAVVNPFVAASIKRGLVVEDDFRSAGSSLLSFSPDGVWLRQADSEGQTVIQAARTNADGSILTRVRMHRFDHDGTLYARIEAPAARLTPGSWLLENATEWRLQDDGSFLRVTEGGRLELPTYLTSEEILDSFAPPETVGFWDLGRFISQMEEFGLLRPAAPAVPAERAGQARALRRHGADRRRLRAAADPLRADRGDDPPRRPRRLRALLPQGLRRVARRQRAKSRSSSPPGPRRSPRSCSPCRSSSTSRTAEVRLSAASIAVAVALALVQADTAARAQVFLGDDATDPLPAMLSADAVTYDRETQVLVASGDVEVLYRGRVLHASRITYDERADQIRAEGPIVLTDPDGGVLLADSAALTPDLAEGLISSARLLIDGQLQLAAAEVRRTDGRYAVLQRTIVSSCTICAGNPTPTWAIRASRVTEDATAQRLYFENARLEAFGVPIAYLPRLSIPEPGVARASGFLPPSFQQSDIYGFGIKAPYYRVLGPSSDATVAPFVTTEGGFLLEGSTAAATPTAASTSGASSASPTPSTRTAPATAGRGGARSARSACSACPATSSSTSTSTSPPT